MKSRLTILLASLLLLAPAIFATNAPPRALAASSYLLQATPETSQPEPANTNGNSAAVGSKQQGPNELEDEEAAFKYSPSVRGIARLTGLSVTTTYWICFVLNFAIVIVLIVMFMKSNVPGMLRGRTAEIQKGIQEARRSSEDANRRLQEVEARLARMNLEIGEMQKKAEADSRAEEERILNSIEEEKKKILSAAEQEIGQAANAARREIQKFAAELAISVAEKGIHVDAAEDKVLVSDFAEQLASQNRNGGGRS